jgi:hypothetical protein
LTRESSLWETYWQCGEDRESAGKRVRRRLHKNIWPSRKLQCIE